MTKKQCKTQGYVSKNALVKGKSLSSSSLYNFSIGFFTCKSQWNDKTVTSQKTLHVHVVIVQ